MSACVACGAKSKGNNGDPCEYVYKNYIYIHTHTYLLEYKLLIGENVAQQLEEPHNS